MSQSEILSDQSECRIDFHIKVHTSVLHSTTPHHLQSKTVYKNICFSKIFEWNRNFFYQLLLRPFGPYVLDRILSSIFRRKQYTKNICFSKIFEWNRNFFHQSLLRPFGPYVLKRILSSVFRRKQYTKNTRFSKIFEWK